jgi:hypothetical protein
MWPWSKKREKHQQDIDDRVHQASSSMDVAIKRLEAATLRIERFYKSKAEGGDAHPSSS